VISNGEAYELWSPLRERRTARGLLRIWEDGAWITWSWEEWLERSVHFAAGLRCLGVRPGERVACLLANSASSCAAVLGTWFTGACLVSLPSIARGMDPSRFGKQLAGILAQCEPALVLVPAPFVDLIQAASPDARVHPIEIVGHETDFEPFLAGSDEAVFIQYSSGSTSEPRGCVVSAGAIARQMTMLSAALSLDPDDDVEVGWVPLSHDMGLFGCLLLSAYWTGVPLVLSTPQRFTMSPSSWFSDCIGFGATLTCGPNFSLELAARSASLLTPGPSRMRKLVVGGERILASTLERLFSALGPERLPREAVLPAYGLAEAVLDVTMTPVGRGPVLAAVDREQLAEGRFQPACSSEDPERVALVPGVGVPLPGTEIDIVGESEVDEVRIRSCALAEGYLDSPALTRSRFTPDGLLTGDLGVVCDRELFITGRKDDLLVVGGRNVYARDIETAVAATGGIRLGNCAVVQVDDDTSPRLVAVVEAVDHHPDLSLMAQRMDAAARAVSGARLSECVFLPRGRFPKTPSGKTQRFRCREVAHDKHTKTFVRVVP
jgi:fatty-acyl-CoA synthase